MRTSRRARGFSLTELLVVLAIVGVLATLLFPAFLCVRGKARQTVCASNLRQIGTGISMYMQDCDGFFPYAVDPVDRVPGVWGSRYAEFAADLPRIGSLNEVLQPYLKSREVFACPADAGFEVDDFAGVRLDAFPTSHEKYGTSYYYRTELAAYRVHEVGVQNASLINMVYDGVGFWHGTLFPIEGRYNVLFADGHVKNVSRAQIDEAWNTPLK